MLVIAKLDRLARNVHFVSGLMESGVEFVVTDMPTVNRLTVHILAAVAEEEARMISARTKAALAAAKGARRPARQSQPSRGLAGAGARRQRREDRAGTGAGGRHAALHRAGPVRRATTLQQLTDALAARGVPTPSGRGRLWHPVQVARIVGRHQNAAGAPVAAPMEAAA